jgi:subtilase family serine protease
VRYYLSTDQARNGGDILLGGTRSVSSLSAGQTSNGNFSVTVPSATPSGPYFVMSCADDLNTVSETNETNNCLASAATMQVARPDLVVTVVGIPTAPAAAGGNFAVTDTVKNQGAAAAGAFTTRYYLSTDSVAGGDVLLAGSDSVSSLSAGQTASDSASVNIPATVLAGAYYVIACTDDLNAVSENDETNNCRVSATTLQVALPDLAITTLTNPPATAAVGGTFRVTDTAKNQGTVTAGASTVRYYLSLDAQKNGGDVLLTGSRAVSSMTAARTSSGNANVTIPAGTAAGSYYLLACADDLAAVPEVDETNNCRASTGVVAVP